MAGDYHRGEMDIHEQASTYAAFGKMTKWGSLAVATLLLFITLLFCTPTGFVGSAIAAVVLLAVGVFALKEKPSSAH
ncbi:aa3-type cytochrome c oxidase subunit IV [uncultured Caulobacter sp.]|uniref:aa3-type cytochrome c oxidase subunit IV n=1 Tax=uncultured Caulobacter sp. TaxID=158749 RepID=UPI0026317E70|nr:aa3-type cytochrome c oxidase subunit IV [uncultured Caulobacter sp.]